RSSPIYFFIFFYNDTATPEIYTLSLHDALPICEAHHRLLSPQLHRGTVPVVGHHPQSRLHDGAGCQRRAQAARGVPFPRLHPSEDRKSTRLNSSHLVISYAVFCLKKKKKKKVEIRKTNKLYKYTQFILIIEITYSK